MYTVSEMTRSNPQPPIMERAALIRCIEVCMVASQACAACADACLGEAMRDELLHCIRLDLDCSDVCATTGRMLSRQQHPDLLLLRHQLELSILAARLCAEECEAHPAHEHCRLCAEACRHCERVCRDGLAALPLPASGRA
jgi:hypothetical protein